MTKGRRPTPPNIVRLRGNPGRRPIRSEHHVAPLAEAPDIVQSDAEAKREWDRITEAMPLGHFAACDVAVMSVHCLSWSLLVAARNQLKAEGTTCSGSQGQVRPHPCIGIMQQQAKRLAQTADRLGLDPVSRNRFALIAVVPGADGGESELDALLKG